jgi:hypothetical protein
MTINDKQYQNNSQGINAICHGVDYLVNQKLGSASYDKTYIGLIKESNYVDNLYTVEINGETYTDVPAVKKFNTGDICLIMSPQNQFNQIFIYGIIDTTDYSS